MQQHVPRAQELQPVIVEPREIDVRFSLFTCMALEESLMDLARQCGGTIFLMDLVMFTPLFCSTSAVDFVMLWNYILLLSFSTA